MDIIKALQQNKMAFGQMSDAMREKAKEIGSLYFQFAFAINDWQDTDGHSDFDSRLTYRLSPSYAPEPEIERFQVYKDASNILCYDKGMNFACQPISHGSNDPDFIGFEYEDERKTICAMSRIYIVEGRELPFYGINGKDFAKTTILTPVAVLFRK